MFGKPTVIAPGNEQRLQTEIAKPAVTGFGHLNEAECCLLSNG